jgi:hypothetical protein
VKKKFGNSKSRSIFAPSNKYKQNKMENTNITINRLDYKNPSENGGFYFLPTLTNIEEIQDVNEVHIISFSFSTREEAELFALKFPKSYKGKIAKVISSEAPSYFIFSFRFNTFFLNNTTGNQNESAFFRRLKVINKIKSL